MNDFPVALCTQWLHAAACPALQFSHSLSLQGIGKTTATGGLEGLKQTACVIVILLHLFFF